MNSLILHSIRMRKVQTASIVVSVALSVALALVLGLIYGGVTRGIDVSAERGGADLLIVPKDARSHLTGASSSIPVSRPPCTWMRR